MKRQRQFWSGLAVLAMALLGGPRAHAVGEEVPQPGLTIARRMGPTTIPILLEAGKAYAVGWRQLGTYRNVKISIQNSVGQYEAYLTRGLGPSAVELAKA